MINLLASEENILRQLYAHIVANVPDNMAKQFLKMPGMHPSRHLALDGFFRSHSFKTGLEFGRATGFTAALFTLLYPEATIDSIDVVDRPWHRDFFKLMGVADRINIITGVSWENVPDKVYDYVLIDANHKYESAKNDWLSIQRHITKGTQVLFDDLTSPLGCGKVFEEIQLPKKKICPALGVVSI